jgi:hypothetical protein
MMCDYLAARLRQRFDGGDLGSIAKGTLRERFGGGIDRCLDSITSRRGYAKEFGVMCDCIV